MTRPTIDGPSPAELFRQRYQSGETSLVAFVNIPSPAVVEMLALLGTSLIVIDGEHGPMGLETCEAMVRAAHSSRAAAIVRLPYPDPRLINRALDTGAAGVLVPHLDSVEIAQEIVAAAKYYPEGVRGAGAVSRAGRYGIWTDSMTYAEWANRNTLVFGILEDAHVVDELPQIMKVSGIDGFSIGHSDLSHDLGYPGNAHHPEVNKVIDAIADVVMPTDKMLCRVARGTGAAAVQDVKSISDQGCRLIGVPFGSILSGGFAQIVDSFPDSRQSSNDKHVSQ